MKQLFYEFIEEAEAGKIITDDEEWPIGFNTIIYDDEKNKKEYFNEQNIVTLEVKYPDKFFELLKRYINLELKASRKIPIFYREKEKNQQKLLMAYLFSNATTEEFLNPEKLLKRKISFLEDKTFENYDLLLDIDTIVPDCKLRIKNTMQSMMMETPNKIEISFLKEIDNKKEEFFLPEISYGITTNEYEEKECFIYSILDPNKNRNILKDNYLAKNIIRKLYKVNQGVLEQESSEYKEYKEKPEDFDYYPENISDVSPSAVVSLTIFLLMLKTKKIELVKGVPYLPVRYFSRELMANSQKDDSLKEKLLQENNKKQRNITDKFIRTFRRVEYHLPSIEIESFPYEMDEFINMKLIPKKQKSNNEFLNGFISTYEDEKNTSKKF